MQYRLEFNIWINKMTSFDDNFYFKFLYNLKSRHSPSVVQWSGYMIDPYDFRFSTRLGKQAG